MSSIKTLVTPHAAAVFEGVGAAIEGAIEMAVDLVLGLAALVEEGELEEGADVGAVAGEGDEDGDVGGVVLGVLAVGVEVDRPLVAPDGEVLAGDVLPHPDPLRQGVALYDEPVRPFHRLRHRSGARRRQRRLLLPSTTCCFFFLHFCLLSFFLFFFFSVSSGFGVGFGSAGK